MNRFLAVLLVASTLIFSGCFEEETLDDTVEEPVDSAEGYWKKHDGTGYIHIEGSVAKFCIASSGSEFIGTYSSYSNTIDIDFDDRSGAHFEVVVSGSSMVLVQEFSGGHATETQYYASSSYPCSGGSNSGSGSAGSGTGGSSSDSSVIFWVGEDFGCGQITVEVEGVGTKTITNYFSFDPDCGESGGATFSGLEAGTYSYTASCTDLTWSSTFTLDENTCLRYELYD